ncbi:cytochrome ubiquinol oxidase subunit I [Pseudomonas sp. PIC25]|uniref:cytochrome ubiquinol oxidase subunit I n=1 Tax=Pseudomonas sp. PIC25 TaxID=1958773 RepID=UPI000BABFD0C|nr:cytochrome ubiquinol oxidase subunit I [Pseudomonas sp. PIC25]PAU65460.1 cytochrome ubiquinol oxidase subunit I [Pseudomonas sp. PIC25]
MFGLDAFELARIQFAFTISFHIIFPAFSIGLASYLAVLEGLWLRTHQEVYRQLYRFWLQIFAVTFAMGVVSGVVMSYQFGTNWAGLSESAGAIMGPLLTYEVLTAFFLEAGFLGIMLFGWNKVGRGLHFFATLMVAIGTLISTFWILSSNSWMHTPQGHELVDGVFRPVDWLQIVFNPSFPFRLAHMAIAAFISTAFIVGATAAWHLLKGRSEEPGIRMMFSMAMWMALLVAPVQAVVGDLHGLNTLEHQPAKIAAIEGHWETGRGVPLLLFGLPDMEAETTRYALGIPGLGSLILAHDWEGEIRGLKEWAKEDRPNSLIVFWSFRVMVGLGLLMILAGLIGGYLRWRGRLYDSPGFHRFVMLLGPSGLLALLAGWITTEVGRQPWVVYGLLRTSDAVSDHGVGQMSVSLGIFVVAYIVVFGVGITYLLRLMRKGPQEIGEIPTPEDSGPGHTRHPMRPLSGAEPDIEDDERQDVRSDRNGH